MKTNANLFNAAVIGENPTTAYILKGDHLHAVESSVAEERNNGNNAKNIVPLMKKALQALVEFSSGKVEAHFLDIDTDDFSDDEDGQDEIVEKIHQIYTHLPHHNRIELSSLIHNRQI